MSLFYNQFTKYCSSHRDRTERFRVGQFKFTPSIQPQSVSATSQSWSCILSRVVILIIITQFHTGFDFTSYESKANKAALLSDRIYDILYLISHWPNTFTLTLCFIFLLHRSPILSLSEIRAWRPSRSHILSL